MQGKRSSGTKRSIWNTIIITLLCVTAAYSRRKKQSDFEAQILPLDSSEEVKNSFSASNVEEIQNFNEALKPFADSGCLIHITSFEPNTHQDNVYKYPVIQRRLNLYQLKVNTYFNEVPMKIEKHVWVMTGRNPPVRYNSSFSKCPHPKFFHLGRANVFDPGSYCNQLKYTDFSLNSKLWACEVLISVFPPILPILTAEQKLEKFELGDRYVAGFPDHWQFHYTGDSNKFPSSMPTFTIVVAREDFHHRIPKMDLVTKIWISTFLAKYALYIKRKRQVVRENAKPNVEAFLFQTDVNLVTQEKITLQGRLKMIYSLKICLQCDDLTRFIHVKQHWRMREWRLHNVTSLLTDLEKHNTNEKLIWWIQESVGGEARFNSKCLTNYFKDDEKKNKWILEASGPVELTNRVVPHVWFEIIRNFTYLAFPNTSCNTSSNYSVPLEKRSIEIIIQPFHILNGTRYYPVLIGDEMFTLRFISCGRPRMSKLAFSEFTNVFDGWIWLFTFLSVIVIILFKKAIQKCCQQDIGNLEKNIMDFVDMVKLLLDKGDFEVLDKPNCSAWKIPFGLFMLTMIVLSNAYRNNNVYNMVKPIESIPYDYFDDLIRNGFRIYSKGAPYPAFKLHKEALTFWRMGSFMHQIYRFPIYHSLVGNGTDGAMLYFDSDISQMFVTFRQSKVQTGTANKLQYIMNHSMLHPDSIVVANKDILSEHYSPDPTIMLKVLQKSQLEFLQQSLKKCDGLALILPQHECTSIEYKWRNLDKLHVGKERLFESMMGFDIIGAVPLRVWNRIKAVDFAGIWLRWRELSQHGANLKRASPNKNRSDAVVPTMSGNTLVIFAIFLGGLGLSIVVFVLECYKLIYKSCCSSAWFRSTNVHFTKTKFFKRRKFREQYPMIYLNEIWRGKRDLEPASPEPVFIRVRPPQI